MKDQIPILRRHYVNFFTICKSIEGASQKNIRGGGNPDSICDGWMHTLIAG